MTKKNKTANPAGQDKTANPFSALKGFAVLEKPVLEKHEDECLPSRQEDKVVDFAGKMAALGVRPLAQDRDEPDHERQEKDSVAEMAGVDRPLSDQDLFLQAMTTLNVDFEDHLPEAEAVVHPSPRRMKRLRKGDLVPAATLDLHGLQRHEVAVKMRSFLQNARYHGWDVLLVITGKGLHSAQGEPVLRQEVELFLQTEGGSQVAEWGRAPRRYGGDGALVLFLRKQS